MKSLLMICRQSPTNTALAQSAIDAALAAGIFEQDIAIVFSADGVMQLAPDQTPTNEKNLAAQIQALPLYGIEKIYIEKSALETHNVKMTELSLPDHQVIDCDELRQLMNHYDHVITL